uniref:Uncharacterized protein n=1 Tax=Culex tarsalis TaxID=7177 RepID=A0A1Q3G010_CULTA
MSQSKQLTVESSGSDELRRVRKTVEVTSTRYTEIVEPSDVGGQPTGNPVLVKREPPSSDLFTTSFAWVDSGIGEFNETVGLDQRKFQEQCCEKMQAYVKRMATLLGDVRKTEASEQFAKLESDRIADQDSIRNSLREVLEGSRERQQRREQELEEVLKHF